MICSVEGRLVRKGPMEAVIDVAGIGYQVRIPLSTSQKLPEEGSQTRLLTCYMIRDENPELYGFYTESEWKIFQKLILLPGVGPKLALRILSSLSPEELYGAVIARDVELLKKTPGIGGKIAERLVVELKGQLEKMGESVTPGKASFVADAVEALVVLGYRRGEAYNLARKTEKALEGKKVGLEEFIREILKSV